jgi:hypothetical protein
MISVKTSAMPGGERYQSMDAGKVYFPTDLNMHATHLSPRSSMTSQVSLEVEHNEQALLPKLMEKFSEAFKGLTWSGVLAAVLEGLAGLVNLTRMCLHLLTTAMAVCMIVAQTHSCIFLEAFFIVFEKIDQY